MKARFSEFSYGFALSYEIIHSLHSTARGAPRFPSLLEEAQLGYDVNFEKLGWPLFLQFKRAEYIGRTTGLQWSSYGGPYYRLAIERRNQSSQHSVLKRLANTQPDVYYVAPCFWTLPEFDTHFVNQAVFDNSIFFRLSNVPPLPDDLQHYITFSPDRPGYMWHSDNAERFTGSVMGSQLFNFIREHRPEPIVIDAAYLLRLRRDLTNIILEDDRRNLIRASDFRGADDPLTKIVQDVRHLLATYFELQMFVIPGP